MSEFIRICDVEKYYGQSNAVTKAVNRVSFTVNQGEFIGIMGASGSGKSTLLNMISTIDTVTAGHIYFEETDITEMNDDQLSDFRMNNLGFVFQDFNLLDTLTMEENITLAMSLHKEWSGKKNEIGKRCTEMMKTLGIEEIAGKFPYQVSGGQKQRCACARALVNDPKLILADEPTGALDSKSSRMLLDTFQKMNDQLHATILMVTHDAFSASYCKRILFLKDGEIFHEMIRGTKSRKEFLGEILDVLSLTGGDTSDVE
ncbi:ABC transporter ATP-binding protein [Anaerosporobacter faecicola]|uniref:ABC transporter ATP-binding protein n=1 Tax=Anaerosporobacter faecicola TaxID=2718714 RepID=UPI00143A7BB4|nr:ABC transporter ATP-binding protein [Anaerosporobacter faecicola]